LRGAFREAVAAASARFVRSVSNQNLALAELQFSFRPVNAVAEAIGDVLHAVTIQPNDPRFREIEIGVMIRDDRIALDRILEFLRACYAARNHRIGKQGTRARCRIGLEHNEVSARGRVFDGSRHYGRPLACAMWFHISPNKWKGQKNRDEADQ
jgi:hypothetical protein